MDFLSSGKVDGSYKAEDEVCANGRLVRLALPSAYFFSWQEAQQAKKRKRDEGSPQE